LIAAAFVVMAVRLGQFVNHNTVNILFWDQWDFLAGLFADADAWTMFRWQHGPQRQGLGGLIIAVLYPATAWNGRADAAASALVMFLAALAALWLVKRVCGSLRAWDAIVPVICLTTTNAESYVLAPNLAHGPLPLLLLVGYALALTVQSHVVRCLALVAINFFSVNTGFTMLMGGVTPILLMLLASAPGLTRRERLIYGTGVAASLATVALFLYGFVPVSATDCFHFPHERPWDYVSYTGLVLARPFGVIAGPSTQVLVGAAIAVGMGAFVTYATLRVLRVRGASQLWLVTCSLAGFAFLFASSTAVGRVCLGLDSANATRYIPYILPGVLALYLVLRTAADASPVAYALLPVLLVLCIAKENDEYSRNEAVTYAGFKQRWRACYLAMHDIETCDTLAGHAIYPAPRATDLQHKLDWLEERGLSLFQDAGR
jgi:hypothetical protein